MTWEELYAEFRKTIPLLTSGKTAENYMRDIDACGFTEKPNKITILKLTKEWKDKGLSNNTINRRYAAIRWIFKHFPREFDPAEAQDCINNMKLKKVEPTMICATKEQVVKIISNTTERTALAIGMMFYGGMRVSEVAACKMSHWKTINGHLTITIPSKHTLNGEEKSTKTLTNRRIIVTKTLEKLYKNYIRGERADMATDLNTHLSKRLTVVGNYDPDGLFLGAKGNLTSKTIQKMVKKACCDAGFPELHDHAFRHGTASALANKKVSIDEIADILGHSSLNTTRRYIHRAAEQVANDMSDALEF